MNIALLISNEATLKTADEFIKKLSEKTSRYIVPVYFRSESDIDKYKGNIHFDFIVMEMDPFLSHNIKTSDFIKKHSTSFGTPVVMIQNKIMRIPDDISFIPFSVVTPPNQCRATGKPFCISRYIS